MEVMLADNRPGKEATEDEGLLQTLLEEVKAVRGDIAGTLYEDRELLKLLRQEKKQGSTDVDDAPSKPRKPFSQLGQIWQLGDHRLFVGDACNKLHVTNLMQGRQADLVFTDPPYNADYTGREDKAAASKMKRLHEPGIKRDSQGPEPFRLFFQAPFNEIDQHLHPGAPAYHPMDSTRYPH